MSANLTKYYFQKTFKPNQIQDAFEKIPIYLKIDKEECSFSANYNYPNGIRKKKEIGWEDLDIICEIKSDSLSCLLLSYHHRDSGSTIIYIESQFPG